jgi:hypothetical protein
MKIEQNEKRKRKREKRKKEANIIVVDGLRERKIEKMKTVLN